ncbi:MAG: DUF3298 domain-containing protein [Planctomycetota bacterium]|nr:DUF3298 domain-containing protein [Planctomycetota bacterium]
MTHRTFTLLGLLALAAACPDLLPRAAAREPSPTARVVKDAGKDAALGFEWEITRVEVTGLTNPLVQRRVNTSLRAAAEAAKREMRRDLREWRPEDRPDVDMPSSLWLHMEVGLLDARLLSVSVGQSTYYAGAAHPNYAVKTLTFDLRTGAKVPVAGLFRPGALPAVAARVHRALRADPDYTYDGEYVLERVTAEHLRAVRVERDGLRFLFGSYELGPYVVGAPEVKLTFAQLEGLLATDGPLGGRAPTRGLTDALTRR